MKRAWTPVFLLALLLPLACRAADPPHALRDKIDQYLTATAKLDHFMGAVLVARGGHVILAKGYGKADIETGTPNTPDTEFRIGSVTKQFTAMAILMLQAEGKLKVQDHVCRYVPDCPADWQPITIAELLAHTSGIPDYLDAVPPATALKIMAQAATPAELIARFRDKPLDFKPGARFKYSNSGYVLLGSIIQRVSGETYGRFLQQHIFGPLGMHATGYGRRNAEGAPQATGYTYAESYEPAAPVNLTSTFSAGGIRSTARDLYTWDRTLDADSGKLIPQALHAQMFAPHALVTGADAAIQLATGPVHYGYGWFIKKEFGHLEYSHEGGLPGFTSLNSWFPDAHVYIIVLDNMTAGSIFRIGRDLAAIVFGQPCTVPHAFKAISLPAQALKKFVGTYQMAAPKLYLNVTQRGDQLRGQMTGQPAFSIYPESATRFFLKAVRAQLFFTTDAGGRVTGVVLHQHGIQLHGKKLSAAEAAAVAATRRESARRLITLSPRDLEKFVGRYRLQPGFVISIRRAGDTLTAQATGQSAFAIYPESPTVFVPKAFKARITFVMDAHGTVTRLVLHQNGQNLSATKIE